MDDPLEVLRATHRIAVVGCSATPGKDAHEVPRRVLEMGYDVVPVNPHATEIFGRKVYPSLAEVPGPIDLVNVFRPSEFTPPVAREAVAVGAKALWLQTGIAHPESERIAREGGLRYVEDACIMVLARRLQFLDGPRGE